MSASIQDAERVRNSFSEDDMLAARHLTRMAIQQIADGVRLGMVEENAVALAREPNFDLPGHRLSDFPHAAIHSGSLAQAAFSPTPMRWVLEIHLRDQGRRVGSFFEDLLLEDLFYDR